MAGIQDFWEFKEDFCGAGLFATSATAYDPWVMHITGTTPTVTRLDHGETAGVFRPGVAQLLFAGSTEAQVAGLHFGDVLSFDANTLKGVEIGLRFKAATGSLKDTATTAIWGVSGDKHDVIDTIAYQALFELKTSATMAVTVETDDGTNDKTDATTFAMVDLSWYKFCIDFSNRADVKFYAGLDTRNSNMQRLGAGTTFDMSNYNAGLQPIFQLIKSSDSNADALQVDYFRAWGVRV